VFQFGYCISSQISSLSEGYWDAIKAKKLKRCYPTIGDYFRVDREGLPTMESFLLPLLKDVSMGSRFRPQWCVLETLPPNFRLDDFGRWMVEQMLTHQKTYWAMLEHLARGVFEARSS
jgi:hypothetical protein